MLETKHKTFLKDVFKKFTKFSILCDGRAYYHTWLHPQMTASVSCKNVYKLIFSNKMINGKAAGTAASLTNQVDIHFHHFSWVQVHLVYLKVGSLVCALRLSDLFGVHMGGFRAGDLSVPLCAPWSGNPLPLLKTQDGSSVGMGQAPTQC